MHAGTWDSDIRMERPTANDPMSTQSFYVCPLCFLWGLSLIFFLALGPEAMEDVVLPLGKKPMIGLRKKTCMYKTTANWLGVKTDLC